MQHCCWPWRPARRSEMRPPRPWAADRAEGEREAGCGAEYSGIRLQAENGERTLRLDMADQLAAYFGLELRTKRKGK
jgi:hypothetical protein